MVGYSTRSHCPCIIKTQTECSWKKTAHLAAQLLHLQTLIIVKQKKGEQKRKGGKYKEKDNHQKNKRKMQQKCKNTNFFCFFIEDFTGSPRGSKRNTTWKYKTNKPHYLLLHLIYLIALIKKSQALCPYHSNKDHFFFSFLLGFAPLSKSLPDLGVKKHRYIHHYIYILC